MVIGETAKQCSKCMDVLPHDVIQYQRAISRKVQVIGEEFPRFVPDVETYKVDRCMSCGEESAHL